MTHWSTKVVIFNVSMC